MKQNLIYTLAVLALLVLIVAGMTAIAHEQEASYIPYNQAFGGGR